MRDGEFLNDALNNTLKSYQHMDKKMRSFISYLTRGSVERFIELDAIISAYSSVKFNKLHPDIIIILRMAVYELRYMDSVPDSATCNEYVKLTSALVSKRLKGFVNAVLRNMIRDNYAKTKLSDNEKCCLPKWLYDKLESEYGNAYDIGQSLLDKRNITIRANLSKCSPKELVSALEEENVKIKAVPDIDYAFMIDDFDHLESLKAFKQGYFYVQDISSMMVGVKSNVAYNDTVIDVCAAPGGKSLHIADLMMMEAKKHQQSVGRVLSYDISDAKVALIRDNIIRAGLNNITVDKRDALIYNKHLKECADIVIADVPCSGIGVINKKPDIRLRLKSSDIDNLVSIQYNILDNVNRYVKCGGKLIYSTCTISKPENIDNVNKFLDNHHDFSLISEEQYMPSDIIDGFFIAILKKSETGS